MKSLLPIILIVAMVAVLVVLLVGIVSMLRGGEFNRKFGNKLMRARVALQFIALLILLALILASRMT
ncbi:MAG: twin transmembrane helix small protein [Alphaproteobacteria bacterium]|nr:twin transmembrane helix small protein [Alphaproteobacteria bacterium]